MQKKYSAGGKYLKTLRRNNHMSQEELAEQAAVSRQTVSRWETGTSTPSTEDFENLSRIFKVPSEQLKQNFYQPAVTAQLAVTEPHPAPQEQKSLPAKTRALRSILITLGIGTFAACVITATMTFLLVQGYLTGAPVDPDTYLGANSYQDRSPLTIFAFFCFTWLVCAALPVCINGVVQIIKYVKRKRGIHHEEKVDRIA